MVCKSEAVFKFLYSNPLNFRKEFTEAQGSLPTSLFFWDKLGPQGYMII